MYGMLEKGDGKGVAKSEGRNNGQCHNDCDFCFPFIKQKKQNGKIYWDTGIFIGNNRHNKIGPTTCRTVYCQHKIFVELYQTVEHKF